MSLVASNYGGGNYVFVCGIFYGNSYEDPIFVLPVLIVVIVFFVLHSCGGCHGDRDWETKT